MGKSPGKWIKSIIFGKKASSLSKERKLAKSASEKPVRVSSKESTSTVILDQSLISGPVPRSDINITDNSVPEKREITKLRSDGLVSSSRKQDGDISTVSDPSPPEVLEYMRLEQAAMVVQALFRSNQVRCEFLKSRKGIIKLQAIVRGRLVRRQAVATFYCVQGIVKLQAIARGNMVRQSNTAKEQGRIQCVGSKDAKHGVSCKSSKNGTSLENAFVYKLLSPSPTVLPLRLQFGAGEPNSAWDWCKNPETVLWREEEQKNSYSTRFATVPATVNSAATVNNAATVLHPLAFYFLPSI